MTAADAGSVAGGPRQRRAERQRPAGAPSRHAGGQSGPGARRPGPGTVMARRFGQAVSAPPTRHRRSLGRLPRQRHGDRGAATVLLLGWLLLVAAAATTVLSISAVTTARRQAVAAADLAALAGAGDRTGDPAAACARAGEFARANGAELTACLAEGWSIEVVVERRLPPLIAHLGPLRAASRAGPWLGVPGSARPADGWAGWATGAGCVAGYRLDRLPLSCPGRERGRSRTRATTWSPGWTGLTAIAVGESAGLTRLGAVGGSAGGWRRRRRSGMVAAVGALAAVGRSGRPVCWVAGRDARRGAADRPGPGRVRPAWSRRPGGPPARRRRRPGPRSRRSGPARRATGSPARPGSPARSPRRAARQ